MSFKSLFSRKSPLALAFAATLLSSTFCFTPSTLADQPKEYTAEQIVESAIVIAGGGFGRVNLLQIRKNGLERGRETRIRPDGRPEESQYEMRFVHGDKVDKDKIRIDSKTPQAEYSLVWAGAKLFGIINGATFTPRADAVADFISQQAHSIDALLRYKENESKISSAGKDKHQGIDVYVIDLVDKANRKTRSEERRVGKECRSRWSP